MKLPVLHSEVGLALKCILLGGCMSQAEGPEGGAGDTTDVGTVGASTVSSGTTADSTGSSSADLGSGSSTGGKQDATSEGTAMGSEAEDSGLVDTGGSESTSTSGDPGDTELPSIVSVDPRDGTTGVFADLELPPKNRTHSQLA